MVISPKYFDQKHIYTDRGQRMEQKTDTAPNQSGNGGNIKLLYVHEDIMGNTRYHTKDNGQAHAELEYDIWGAPTSPSKLENNDNGTFIFAQFTGHIYDTVLDIYFAEARFYDAKNRQWLSSDPMKDGLNWYQYVRSNPATFIDSSGLWGSNLAEVLKDPAWVPELIEGGKAAAAAATGASGAAAGGAAVTGGAVVTAGAVLTGVAVVAGAVVVIYLVHEAVQPKHVISEEHKVGSGRISKSSNPDSNMDEWQLAQVRWDAVKALNEVGMPFNKAVARVFSPDYFVDIACENMKAEGISVLVPAQRVIYYGTDTVTYIDINGVRHEVSREEFESRGLTDKELIASKGVRNPWGSADNLVDSAVTPGKGGVTPVGRAFQKHAGNAKRAGTFTGEVSGNTVENTKNGLKYLNDILNNPNSTYTVRNTKAFGDVLDVRLPNGTGARWTADGKTFIGFLEKYTPNN